MSFPEFVSDQVAADARELLGQRRRVDRRLVSVEEMVKAAAAISEFNRQSGSEFGLGAHLTPIVMRIRDRPGYDAEAHVRLVQSAWRIQWWRRSARKGRVAPNVLYGSTGCFENVVQDAVDEKAGRTPESCRPGGARRFERSTPIEADL